MGNTVTGLIIANVPKNVEVVAKREQDPAQTLLHNTVEKIVLDQLKSPETVTHKNVQVNNVIHVITIRKSPPKLPTEVLSYFIIDVFPIMREKKMFSIIHINRSIQ